MAHKKKTDLVKAIDAYRTLASKHLDQIEQCFEKKISVIEAKVKRQKND